MPADLTLSRADAPDAAALVTRAMLIRAIRAAKNEEWTLASFDECVALARAKGFDLRARNHVDLTLFDLESEVAADRILRILRDMEGSDAG